MKTRALIVAALLAGWHAALPVAASGQVLPHPHGSLPDGLDCSSCHTDRAWTPLRLPLPFQHHEWSSTRLTGAHEALRCGACHLDLRFDVLDAAMDDCAGCHLDVHQGRMAQDCADCHDTRAFQGVDGEWVHTGTSFPLVGAHAQVTCESCHVSDIGGAYSALDTDCVACHREEYESAVSIDHVAGSYPTDCTACHNAMGWADSPTFDHAGVVSGFQIVGAHQGLRCASCHVVPGYALLFRVPAGQDDCVACHQDDYDRAHGGAGFPTDCAGCHGDTAWEPATFEHDTRFFPINSGAHGGRWSQCADCHVNPGDLSVFSCLGCHEHSQSRMDEKHREESGYVYESGQCLSCHPRGRS